jgi:porphobilinogen synthase
MTGGRFPQVRMRRLRRTEPLRRLVRETTIHPGSLILPLFVVPGEGVRRPVASMPGVEQTSIDELLRDAGEVMDLGLGGVMLFGIPDRKDALGSEGYAENGIVPRAVRALREAHPDLLIVTDVCLCEYTDHGHCGVLSGHDVDNDRTLPLLGRAAVAHARAGADIVAPSDMMDGRVAAIRAALDDSELGHIPILSYAAKFASAFYGPFRDAAESTPAFGDRRAYQMDPANGREALLEVELDLQEGADIVMVKPALPYLDVIARVRAMTDRPLAAYHVSGEYAAVMAAAERGWIDGDSAMREALVSIRRAGADIVVTYYARQFVRGAS